jgi:hypothetical protein
MLPSRGKTEGEREKGRGGERKGEGERERRGEEVYYKEKIKP